MEAMRVDLTQTLKTVQSSNTIWDRVAPLLPEQENFQGLGIGVADITRAFEEVETLLQAASKSNIDGIAWCVHKSNFDNTPNAMLQFFEAHQSNPAQFSANPMQLCSWLWSLKSSLVQIIPVHPEAARLSPEFERLMTGRIEEAQEWFEKAKTLKSDIDQIEAAARKTLEALQLQQEQSQGVVQTVQGILTTIEGQEREAGTAKTNAISSAATANADAATVSKLVQELTASVQIKTELFKEFEDRRDEISGLLENANKVGLARSFSEKRKELTWTWRGWAGAFLAGIGGLLWIGLVELLPLLKAGTPDLVAVIVRFLVATPLVWFTWFAARQYGHVLRVSEDYAFKEAAAMAFAGYRNEMGADPEMLKLLQESAIRNFGANPAEMLLKQADAASPMHEALERALEKLSPKEVFESLTALATSLKK
jgi:hypothetical protein